MKINDKPGSITARGGQYLGQPDGPLGRLLAMAYMFAEDDGTGTGAAADGAAADGAAAAGDGAAADGAEGAAADEGATEAAYTLPDDYESSEDADLRALFETLEADITAIKGTAEADLTDAMLAEAKDKRAAQGKITELLQSRIDAAAARKAELDGLDTDAPTLPEAPVSESSTGTPATKAAGAAPVAQPTAAGGTSAVTAVRDRELPDGSAPGREAPMSKLASVAAVTPRWVTQSKDPDGGGQAVSWRDMVNDTIPAQAMVDGGHISTMKPAVMAAARVSGKDPERTLTDSLSHNERIIAVAMDEHRARRWDEGGGAKMAAICDPPTIFREATTCGTDATPFQNALVSLEAQSGNALQIMYRLPTSMSVAEDGIGEWDTTKQAAIDRTDPETWKPCVPIACPGYDTQTAKEITACYEIGAFTELSSPETEADFVQAKDRAFARFTEGWHLRKTDEFLRFVSFNGFTGAVPDVIEAVLTSIASGDYGERLEPGAYTVFGSPGLLYALAIDENRKAFRPGMTAALQDVQQIVTDATNTSYVQLLDRELNTDGTLKASPFGSFGAVGAASATVMPKLNSITFTLRIVDTSSIVKFNTGEATFGQGITLDQARRNQRGFFQRIFGGQLKPGCAPGYKVAITICLDGSRGGFVEPGCLPTGFTSEGVPFLATPQG